VVVWRAREVSDGSDDGSGFTYRLLILLLRIAVACKGELRWLVLNLVEGSDYTHEGLLEWHIML